MEDLGFSAPGRVIHDVLDGVFDSRWRAAIGIDGGLQVLRPPDSAPRGCA